MPLFDKNAEHIGIRPKNYLEPTFEYYNKTERKDIQKIKDVLESWYAAYPDAGKEDLRSRFRSKIESQHQAAFSELWVHQIARRLNFEIQIHPEIGCSTHPDFRFAPHGGTPFLVEVTTTNDSDEEVAAQRRIDQVYDTLNRLKSPDFFIGIIDKGKPVSPVPGARLRGELDRWLKTLSWDKASELWDKGGFDLVPSFDWKYETWDVTFKVIPKSKDNRGSDGVRPIGLTMPTEIRQLVTDEEIKNAIEGKDKYGEPDIPLLVVVNVLGDFCERYDVMNALFGHETVLFGPDGVRPGGRLRDGAWDGPRGPQHRAISAAWVLQSLNAWSAHDPKSWIVHNPWARVPLKDGILPFTQYLANQETGKLEEKVGTRFAAVLGLPDPWPPDED